MSVDVARRSGSDGPGGSLCYAAGAARDDPRRAASASSHYRFLFDAVREQVDGEASIVAAIPSEVSDRIEVAARRAGFEGAETLAAPCAGAIAFVAARILFESQVVAVVCASGDEVDVGLFNLIGLRVLPLFFSCGLDGEACWRACTAFLREKQAVLGASVFIGDGAGLARVVEGNLLGARVVRMGAETVCLGALRCAELIAWDEVIPIHDEET